MFNFVVTGNVIDDQIKSELLTSKDGKTYKKAILRITTGKYFNAYTDLDIGVYGKMAETCEMYLSKGSLVTVTVRVTSPKDNSHAYEFTATDVQFHRDWNKQKDEDLAPAADVKESPIEEKIEDELPF